MSEWRHRRGNGTGGSRCREVQVRRSVGQSAGREQSGSDECTSSSEPSLSPVEACGDGCNGRLGTSASLLVAEESIRRIVYEGPAGHWNQAGTLLGAVESETQKREKREE